MLYSAAPPYYAAPPCFYFRTLQDSTETKILKIQDYVTAVCNKDPKRMKLRRAVSCSIATQMYDATLQRLWKVEAENKSCTESLQVWRARISAQYGEPTSAPDNRMYFEVPAASSEVISIYIFTFLCVLYYALSCLRMLTYA